ncbi:Uncharacterised protein [Stenotrophomonas maltophilia]|nr:Uncharacterised protein [Stenotrophomonas maltophilia]
MKFGAMLDVTVNGGYGLHDALGPGADTPRHSKRKN